MNIKREGGRVTLRLDRPEVGNALDGALVARLAEALDTLRGDPAVRVVVLTGTGKIFSAGADLNWMRRMKAAGPEANLEDARTTAALFARLADFPRPVIAAVNGPARGGGVGLVAAADFAIASRRATFAFTEVRLGVVPAMISPYVVRKLGEGRTRRLFLTGETFTAEQAQAFGLVDQVVEPETLATAVAAFVEGLKPCAPEATGAVKRLLAAVRAAADAELPELTARWIAEIRATPEAQEGMAAFLEKRPPRWAEDRS